MKKKHTALWPAMASTVLLLGLLVNTGNAQGQPPPGAPGAPGGAPRPFANLPPIPPKGDTTHTLTAKFIPATGKKAPDADGFIRRWLVLEPVKKDITRNNILSDSYVRTAVAADNFSSDFTVVPKKDATVKVGDQELKWYAVESKTFNFNLYHFTYAIEKPRYGILAWLVTVIDCPEEMKDVRLAAGCNSASVWWLNGKEVLMLPGDKDLVADYATSQRVTLKKGRNIIRGAVINGPGMANFCVRILNEKGAPVKNFTVSCE